jgi:hypothetical protein
MPTEWAGQPDLVRRLYQRGERPEYRFFYADHVPILPLLDGGEITFARWGNRRGLSPTLPRARWTKRTEVESGFWRDSGARKVEVAASYALAGRGVWYQVVRGIEAILVTDGDNGDDVVYLVSEPASHYYQIMTGDEWMPCLIEQFI